MIILCGKASPDIVDSNVRARPVVSGGTLRTDTGQIIRSGAVVSVTGTAAPQALDPAVWDDARALGLNCMRVGVKVASATIAQTLGVVDQVVEIARTRRMYVMLLYAETSPGDWQSNVTANRGQYISFWGQAASRYATVPHVFYEMVNEPVNGGPAWGDVSQFTTAVRDGLRDVFDVMRASAPETVILWPSTANLSPSSAQVKALIQDMDTRGNGQPVDYARACWSFHHYGGETANGTFHFAVSGANANANDGGRAGILDLKASYPVIMTESNWFQDTPAREWLIDVLDILEDIGVSWVLLRRPNQTSPQNSPILAPLYLAPKIAQLRSRGFVIPVE